MKEISLHILDLVQNSIRAGAATVSVTVSEDRLKDRLGVRITDDGCGMDAEMVRKVQSPFVTSRSTRKVGLGIPLFQAGCLNCEGEFDLTSTPGGGTEIYGAYRLSHIDRPPLGNLADTIYLLVAANPLMDFSFTHTVDGSTFSFDTAAVREQLQGVPLDEPEVLQWICEYLLEGEKDLYGGAPQ